MNSLNTDSSRDTEILLLSTIYFGVLNPFIKGKYINSIPNSNQFKHFLSNVLMTYK